MIIGMQVIRGYKLKCLYVLLAIGALVGLVVAAAGGGGSSTGGGKNRIVVPSEPNASRRAYALLAGLPQRGTVLGSTEAPVTLQFFGDLQCKQSRQVMLGALPFLIRRFVRAGELQIHFRSWETDTNQAGGWIEFREQQSAALAAGKQGKLWSFIDVFYREQGPEGAGYVDEAFLNRIAVEAGLDLEAWDEARASPYRWVPQLETDKALAGTRDLESTPAFLIGPTGGRARVLRHFVPEEPKVFEEAIEELL